MNFIAQAIGQIIIIATGKVTLGYLEKLSKEIQTNEFQWIKIIKRQSNSKKNEKDSESYHKTRNNQQVKVYH